MARKQKTPFDKIMEVQSRLRLYAEFGDVALVDTTPQEFAKETDEAFRYLLSFRNMVNGMASLEEPPEDAVLLYLPEQK